MKPPRPKTDPAAGDPGASDRRATLAQGRAAYARRAWAEAHAALVLADEAGPLDAGDLQLLALASALSGHDDVHLRGLERLYQLHLDAGSAPQAARAAFWLCMRLFALGEVGRASGWLARAQRALEQAPGEHAEHGYLLVPAIQRHLRAGAYEEARQQALAAAAIAARFRDADLAACARCLLGRALVGAGQLDEGLAALDEVMVAAAAGELSPVMTGIIYCSAIASCMQVYAIDRTREWIAALADWCASQPELVSFNGRCLIHRAEILELNGSWTEAIAEAQRAGTRCVRGADAEAAGDALYQQAEIHRLRGEHAEAEEHYRRASERGVEPQPGLALLRLAQDQPEAAASAIRRVLGATAGPLRRARHLPAAVEILLAAGARDEAAAACAELESIAAGWKTDVLGAIAAHARATLDLAGGDAEAVLAPVRRAFAVWQALGAPYLAARLRVLLGRACLALGDGDGARLELGAARAIFAELGAARDLAVLDGLAVPPAHARTAAARPHGLTERELEVLRLVATGKTNKVIAEQLTLSEKTVDRHVSNIFNKIDVASRAAATAFAYEQHLV